MNSKVLSDLLIEHQHKVDAWQSDKVTQIIGLKEVPIHERS